MHKTARVSLVRSVLPVSYDDVKKMVKKALDLIGGIDSFVKPHKTVVIKPNIFAPYPPPVTTDRRIISVVVSLCKEAGAKRVIVIEGISVGSLMMRVDIEESTTSGELRRGMKSVDVMKLLGIKRGVEESGGEILGVEDSETSTVMVPGGKVLHSLNYPKAVLDADVFINIPALKTHTMTMVTLGIKNLQGFLNEGDRYRGHRDDCDQHMVDILKVRKPDLTLIDGLIGMEGMGAGERGTPVPMGIIIMGADVVAVDSVASRVMGIESPRLVGTTRIAEYDGLGVADPHRIEVLGESIESVRKTFLLPLNFTQPISTFVTGIYPHVDVFIGGACQTCWGLAAFALMRISRIKEGAALIVGIDPKVPIGAALNLKNTFILGDCALGCAGEVREIRNKIALAGFDTFLSGCPPYEQAMVKLEDILVNRGVMTKKELVGKAEESRQRFFNYYKKYDPTWDPEI